MEPLSRTIVLLAVITTVICTPLLNELPPGKDWPPRGSVTQPNDHENEPSKIQTESEKEPESEKDFVTADPIIEKLDVPQKEPQILSKTANDEKVDYTGAQLWKVIADKNSIRATIVRLKRRNLISTWAGNHSYIDVFIKPNAIENVTRVFRRENISYEVVIDDMQKRINEENPPLDENVIELEDRQARAYNFWRYRASNRRLSLVGAYMGYNSLDLPMEYWPSANWGHRMTWKQYHRLADIHGFMDYLAKTYPAIVSVNSIGKSYEGRDLKVIRISDGKPTNKAVFIDGGIHAREWISPATVTYFINQFAESFDGESDDIKNIDWYFLPVVNPDGYEFTHAGDRLWRKNRKPGILGRACIGTDLNRNFGYRWGGKGASNNPCSEIYRGSRAFSEPESRALSEFIKTSAANFSAYITYHSYGQYLLYPWGYDNAVPPDHKELNIVGQNIAQAIKEAGGSSYQVGSSSGLLYPAAGGSDDWAKGQGIKYTYTIELSDTGRYGFVLPTSYIIPVAKESLAGLRVLAKQIHAY